MSQASISYGSLKDASSEAHQVSKKLDKYANNLESQILKKFNNYNGNYTSNISQAKSNINSKISELRRRADAYSRYSSDLNDLKEQCLSTDKAVKTNVSKLTSQFKAANGIKDNVVINTINNILTSIGNSTSFGRWFGNQLDKVNSGVEYVKQSLEDWWDYEGGKQLVKGSAYALAEGVLAVCAIIAAFSAGSIIAVVAGVVAGIIAVSNAWVNLKNEKQAYITTNNGDPATGRRRSEINTEQDYLRSSFYYGDDGTKYEYNKNNYLKASVIDTVNTVCQIITFVDGIGTLAKKAYKWTTGSGIDIKQLKMKNILTKDNFKLFKTKVFNSISTGFTEIKTSISTLNFSKIGEFMLDFKSDFIINLKNNFTIDAFKDSKTTYDYLKNGASLVSNYATISKNLLKDVDFEHIFDNGKALFNIGINDFLIKNISIMKYDIKSDTDYKSITIDDILSKKEKFSKILDGMQTKSEISIAIPEIKVPKITGICSFDVDVRINFIPEFAFSGGY
jgi:hypothetical protein